MVANTIERPFFGSREPSECRAGVFEYTGRLVSLPNSDESADNKEFEFVLLNDHEQIAPVVEFLASQAARMAVTDSTEQMRISLALEEALVNALYHGNLEISSDADSWYDLAQRRRLQSPFCDRRIRVLARITNNFAVFVVRDEGHGFDPSQLADPTNDAHLGRCSGRGVYLMRNLMDEVVFNDIGNEVTMVRRWNGCQVPADCR
jgi:anti-sigma regulatory factor (Ser/Thr protein kinase)